MSHTFQRLSVAAFLGASLIAASCVSVGPTATNAPSFSLAPGATATVPPAVTPTPTLAPGATLPPITPEPPVTAPPVTEPTPTSEHPNWPPGAIEPNEAANNVGNMAIVCGKVNGANWVFAKKGHPTWLNLGPAYPNQRFNVVIWGEQRRQWPLNGKPDVVYLGKVICVTEVIQAYQGWTQMQNVEMGDIQVIP